MSNVLAFRPAFAGGSGSQEKVLSGGAASMHVSGEIVIFPGVRYERASEPGEPSPKPSRGGRGKARGGK
ncbi:MAG: hypothetical protein K2Q28_06305 [Hyphomicrobium sp.]|nr:hypothetical protein [Hyphomicrobium sp.]